MGSLVLKPVVPALDRIFSSTIDSQEKLIEALNAVFEHRLAEGLEINSSQTIPDLPSLDTCSNLTTNAGVELEKSILSSVEF